ncbi:MULTISPECIES: NAD(P)/FAD-dependent oxidoreductase [Streptomyces]|uniref:FAD-dependent oxidoreductase n=2 Tax=Streptomyces TaxID=1883 RepID=A0ABU2RIQ2_9ACTN|nr:MULTISPECIES: FAD-dependent oxidoreductase [unclassified Streptomyces]MBK3596906.1 FAD-dependent oxidoreductase [Streptomyces sp. MBT51]MDT0428679.1 FAD-dependent oxidoreductase [Streptomyces sp. DSM 41770]MYX77439.1 FAD-dependent oxidoreductase [Streptomyces sp. SID3915]SCD92362.1 Glycine/D-amino acid oxidase [Streptomyces sp. BpilaLS-43]
MATDAMRHAAASLSGARPRSYWLDDPAEPEPRPALTGDEVCDLLVVGGGYSGLWTALLAKERDPRREVVLIEGREVGWAASGRNGGFCAASLTHGTANGLDRWPEEIAKLEQLGARNLDAIEEAVTRYGIDCDFERTGEIDVATRPHELSGLRDWHRRTGELGLDRPEFLDQERMRAEVDSPAFLGGLWDRRGVALLHPAKLAWGLKRACLRLGVRVYEHTPGLALARSGAGVAVRTPYGRVFARRAALATNVFPSLVRRLRPYTVPVYDYALMTEPLSADRLASIGWKNRQGLGDSAHRFHYFRLSADNRILWGGFDAVYPFGGRLHSALDRRPETFLTLAGHFFAYFPQLSGVRFTHAWGGAIDTCSRFSAFFTTAYGGRVAHAAGYTGLGVGATRFGAEVMLDLLAGDRTERTGLRMVRSKPLPFPPEPFAWAGIGLTKRSLARADDRGGHRDLWLRTTDRLGFGFDS